MQLQFPSSLTRGTRVGGGVLSVSTEEGEGGSETKGQQRHAGGHLRGKMKETASGYQANEWQCSPSLIES